MAGINYKPIYSVRAILTNGYETKIGLAYRQANRRIRVVIEYVPIRWNGEYILVPIPKKDQDLY